MEMIEPSSTLVGISALHARVLGSKPGPGIGMFGAKTWLCIPRDVTLMSVTPR